MLIYMSLHTGGELVEPALVLEDIGNGTRDVLDNAGRALTGSNGTTNRSTANGTR